MKLAVILGIALISPALCGAESRFSITRDEMTGAGSGRVTIALFCRKGAVSDCRVLRARNGVETQGVAVSKDKAKAILDSSRAKLSVYSSAVDPAENHFRWALAYRGKDLHGSLAAPHPAARKKLLQALLGLEAQLANELDR